MWNYSSAGPIELHNASSCTMIPLASLSIGVSIVQQVLGIVIRDAACKHLQIAEEVRQDDSFPMNLIDSLAGLIRGPLSESLTTLLHRDISIVLIQSLRSPIIHQSIVHTQTLATNPVNQFTHESSRRKVMNNNQVNALLVQKNTLLASFLGYVCSLCCLSGLEEQRCFHSSSIGAHSMENGGDHRQASFLVFSCNPFMQLQYLLSRVLFGLEFVWPAYDFHLL